MILPLFRKTRLTGPVLAAYNCIVAQSRREIFYAQWGIEDSLTGRFDMLSLHMALVFRRLRQEDKTAKAFSQNLFDCFFHDMDRSLREMGVGDLSVGKRIEKMGSLFYGLLAAVNEAMDSGDPAQLKAVLSRNLHDGATHPALDAFADYVLLCDDVLATQDTAAILGGNITFGEPA
ncbi:ubiquinol-cytochrome C chaperone family protein [Pelagibacterium halotolerans]|uniref:ubiquinol-cytochrome C chaperone family protein n=1 Tax=Pelagibacterium halotolerans TaxID=531813 RepID=UPI00385057F7